MPSSAVRFVRTVVALWLGLSAAGAHAQQRADAALIVNSASPRYADAERLVRPYLNHFGVPYRVVDVATTSIGADIGDYALIIIGHASLDTTGQYLDATEHANLSNAVALGAGLVNFDYDLTATGSTGRYRFVQDVFAFGYRAATSGEGALFTSAAPGHFVTQRHPAGQVLPIRQMASAALLPPSDGTVLTRFQDSGNPLLVVRSYGLGRAVQWGGYAWMTRSIYGPLRGMDDLVWRGMAWAARKPFVMEGMPNFLTMRVDDVIGPFWYVRAANAFNMKPWLGLFYQSIPGPDAIDLSALVNAGQATASVHATAPGFFYYDHFAQSDFSDAAVAEAFQNATAWHDAYGIPSRPTSSRTSTSWAPTCSPGSGAGAFARSPPT